MQTNVHLKKRWEIRYESDIHVAMTRNIPTFPNLL